MALFEKTPEDPKSEWPLTEGVWLVTQIESFTSLPATWVIFNLARATTLKDKERRRKERYATSKYR